MRGSRSRSGAGLLVVALWAAGCASAITSTEGGYRHRRHGYTIAAPGAGWERVSVDDAALAFRWPGAASMSLQSICGRPVASPQLMARHLVIGFRNRELVHAGPVVLAGSNAWSQTFDTVQGETRVRVKTVTLVAGDCTFDWILAMAVPVEALEASFDAWWASFRLDEPAAPAAAGEA